MKPRKVSIAVLEGTEKPENAPIKSFNNSEIIMSDQYIYKNCFGNCGYISEMSDEQVAQIKDDLDQCSIEKQKLQSEVEHERRINIILSDDLTKVNNQLIEQANLLAGKDSTISAQANRIINLESERMDWQDRITAQKDHINRLEDKTNSCNAFDLNCKLEEKEIYIKKLQEEVTKLHNETVELKQMNRKQHKIIIRKDDVIQEAWEVLNKEERTPVKS